MASRNSPLINPQPMTSNHTQDSMGRRRNTLATYVFFGAMFLFIVYGWIYHDELYIAPDSGLGYNLGIIGGSLMLILLFYPLRKKVRFLSRIGSMKFWFRSHMALGVIGPTLIFYHANFGLGSVNSNVAMFSMILVALSGLVGRFIYTHIHYDLYGKQMTLEELGREFEKSKHTISEQLKSFPHVISELETLTSTVTKNRNFIQQVICLPIMTIQIYLKRKTIKRVLKQDIKNNKNTNDKIDTDFIKLALKSLYRYIETIRKIAQLSTYERLFSLWHVLHMPLFIMLIITGIIHVIAVHMY